MKYKELNLGQIKKIIKKLGGMKGVEQFLDSKIVIFSKSKTQNGITHLSVTSDGTTGVGWIVRLENKVRIFDNTKDILCSPNFKPTNDITTRIVVLNGLLFKNDNRTTEKIQAYANRQKFITPNAEIVCLLRENLTNNQIKSIGLEEIIVMHDPINEFLLGIGHDDYSGRHQLDAHYTFPSRKWVANAGFAFAIP